MKAQIEIDLGNDAFGNNDAERLFEMRNVMERLSDNADRIMCANIGDFVKALDSNGNTVATLNIVGDDVPSNYGDDSIQGIKNGEIVGLGINYDKS
jgi:hypothetical protein